MLGNDTAGDSPWAAQANAHTLWAANFHQQVVITTDEVIRAYQMVTGYDRSAVQPDGANPTDKGTAPLDALKYWRTIGIDRRTITAFLEVDPRTTIR